MLITLYYWPITGTPACINSPSIKKAATLADLATFTVPPSVLSPVLLLLRRLVLLLSIGIRLSSSASAVLLLVCFVMTALKISSSCVLMEAS